MGASQIFDRSWEDECTPSCYTIIAKFIYQTWPKATLWLERVAPTQKSHKFTSHARGNHTI